MGGIEGYDPEEQRPAGMGPIDDRAHPTQSLFFLRSFMSTMILPDC